MPKDKKLKQRTLLPSIKNVSETFPVTLITGPRQVGKTTLFKLAKEALKDERAFISLDNIKIRILAQKDPEVFLQQNPYPLLIDEIQYAPELLPYIKMKVDEVGENGMYWLTGSQQFHLMKDVSESLAGRVGILNLQGLSQAEKNDKPNTEAFLPTKDYLKKKYDYRAKDGLKKLYSTIWRGSFPRIVVDKAVDWKSFYSAYVQTYIERDVRALTNVGNEEIFAKFLVAVAARTGQLLNYEELSRDVGISQPTVKTWLSILKTSHLIYLLQPYHTNLTKRLIKTPKLYFLDTGLCSYLTAWDNPEVLERGAMSGAILETYVISELLKSYWHNNKRALFYFYRDQDMKEIDLLIYKNGTLYPIEVKKSSNPNENDIRHFSTLKRFNLPIGHGAVICLCDRVMPISKDVDAVPTGCI